MCAHTHTLTYSLDACKFSECCNKSACLVKCSCIMSYGVVWTLRTNWFRAKERRIMRINPLNWCYRFISKFAILSISFTELCRNFKVVTQFMESSSKHSKLIYIDSHIHTCASHSSIQPLNVIRSTNIAMAFMFVQSVNLWWQTNYNWTIIGEVEMLVCLCCLPQSSLVVSRCHNSQWIVRASVFVHWKCQCGSVLMYDWWRWREKFPSTIVMATKHLKWRILEHCCVYSKKEWVTSNWKWCGSQEMMHTFSNIKQWFDRTFVE